MGKEKAVVLSSLSKRYAVNDLVVNALQNIDLEVSEGELVAICGHSGAGKTTLLNMVAGLDRPTSGKIEVFGHNLADYREDSLATFRCANIGYVFQSYNLISTLTAQENIMFPLQLAGWSGEIIEERSRKLLELVNLFERANHLPSQLSGGELQRAAFARALANDPPIFLADEPTGNLDLDTGLEIIRILEGLKEKKTILASTHDERIMKIADHTVMMSSGRIVSMK